MADKELINIFYSWQSDSPNETNRIAIRSILHSLVGDFESPTLSINIDEATSNTTGSVNIPASIFEKISISDIFVCDVTTINTDCECVKRKTANPNVLIELGFAISEIGWERIILLFNKEYGTFPDDLPFDIDRHRTIDFKISSIGDNNGKGQLKATLFNAIDAIVKAKPFKPYQTSKLTPDDVKKQRDVKNISLLLGQIHINTFDWFVEEFPAQIVDRIFFFWEGFKGILSSSTFHLYDEQLESLIKDLHRNWGEALNHGERYYSNFDQIKAYKFGSPTPEGWDKKDNEIFKKLMELKPILSKSFKDVLTYIRANYVEIDIEALSEKANDEYIRFMEE